jgi:alanyl-tRNA synthetase
MTQRIYQHDSYVKNFSSQIQRISQTTTSEWEVVLEKTAFYPTAGGQQHDIGELAGFPVVSVRNDANGEVIHTITSTASNTTIGLHSADVVNGSIDWQRRFDLMQQHSGEHLLGQAFYRLNYPVIAVHMGLDNCTLDLAGLPSSEDIAKAELEANRAIYRAEPVTVYEIDESEVPTLPLRRPPQVSGRIRVVQMGDYDYSACGGTHVHSTAEVGVIKILKAERAKSGAVRLLFCCGERALHDYRSKHEVLGQLGRRLSVPDAAVGQRVEHSLDELGAYKQELAKLRAQLATSLVAQWCNSSETIAGQQVVVQECLDTQLWNDLAKAVLAHPNTVLILWAIHQRCALAVASSGTCSANTLLQRGLSVLGGKGGGKPEFAQGSANTSEHDHTHNQAKLQTAIQTMLASIAVIQP